MKRKCALAVVAIVGAVALSGAFLVRSKFHRDLAMATERAAQGSAMVDTRCGAIDVQQAGTGIPLLVIHGSGGGHDQGMADASPEAQADAHVCLLDALGIESAAILGVSAGAPSAMQLAIRHPQRVSALVLVVPIAYKPATLHDSARTLSDDKDALLLRLLASDFLFWVGQKFARDALIRHVLATPPEQIATASDAERLRVADLVERILPVSRRAAGLRDDTRLGKSLGPYALSTIRAPTLVISARDDGFGTYASAQYVAGQIPGAKFIGFEDGGHLLVGHDAQIQADLAQWLRTVPDMASFRSGRRHPW